MNGGRRSGRAGLFNNLARNPEKNIQAPPYRSANSSTRHRRWFRPLASTRSSTTNPIENMNCRIRATPCCRVKRWNGGTIILR
jgi:hypothetical protein